MKIKFRYIITIIAVLVLIIAVTVNVSSVHEKELSVGSAQLLDETIKRIRSEIPSDVFAGMYIDENGEIVVNVTEFGINKAYSQNSTINGYDVRYNAAKYSLNYLTSVTNVLADYMAEYHIATLDANDSTNKIDVEMYDFEYKAEVESVLYQYVDPNNVNIMLLPEGVTLQFSVRHMNNEDITD